MALRLATAVRPGAARSPVALAARARRGLSSAVASGGIDPTARAALGEHFEKTMQFHLAVDFDETHGGYYQQITREGTVLDHVNRNLNNTTRGVYTYALAAKTFADSNPDLAAKCVEGSRHGVRFLQDKHRLADGSYAGDLKCEGGATEVVDATKLCYGHGFVLLALSGAHMVGAAERSDIEGIWELLESRFYRPEDELYVDEIGADGWDQVAPYRGQNANMHMTEAMLCAFEATGDEKYLARARSLAHRICVGLASQAKGGLVWEHFSEDWTIDYEFNLDDKQHLIRPWGFLPGHSAEWAKLLCILHRLQPDGAKEDWIIPAAENLFDHAVRCWDTEGGGGILYTFGPDGEVCDDNKYMWPHPEAFAAALLLHKATGSAQYMDFYRTCWQYSWEHLADAEYGGWYGVLDRANEKVSNPDYGAGDVKAWFSDYHSMGGVYECMRSL